MGTPSDARPAQRVAGGAGHLPCPNCGRQFQGKAGVSLHHHRVHPEAYHKDHVPEQRRKAQWDYEEKVILASGEITMLEARIAVNSKTLAEQLLGRSSEAIKKMRQSEEYKRILQSLNSAHGMHDGTAWGSSSSSACAIETHDGRVDGGDSPEAQATFGSPSMPSQVAQEQPEIRALGPQTNDSVEQQGSSDALRKAVEGA